MAARSMAGSSALPNASTPPETTRIVETNPHRVLGIDPGLNVCGYAVLEPARRGSRVIEAGVIRPGRAADRSLTQRLVVLYEGIRELLTMFRPAALALEQVHAHPQHPATSIQMAHGRGVILLAAGQQDVAVTGYAAARIKKTLTGSGRAPKEQMQHAVQLDLGLERLPEPHDVADACAVALCHLHQAGWVGPIGRA